MVVVKSLADRVWPKVQKTDACWLWIGALKEGGYGHIRLPDRTFAPAHRVVYELVVGPIPEGLQLDHLCRNPRCVRPEHLEPVTPSENTLRSRLVQRERTHCPQGHPYARSGGRGIIRRCKTCLNAQARAYRARQEAAGLVQRQLSDGRRHWVRS